MKYFVLHKEGRTGLKDNSLFRNAERQLCVWESEDVALKHAAKAKSSWETWRVRPANSNDFAAIGSEMKWPAHKKPFVVMDRNREDLTGEKKQMAKKTTSTGCLVEVFEDVERRKFAISSKSSSEAEFIVEVSQALSASAAQDWNIRLRETLPLIVDICCKYRGYKAESVQERREFVAGDLEMPKAL